MTDSPAPEIARALGRRFFIARLCAALIPLAFCLVFSAGTGFLLVRAYAERSGGVFEETGFFPLEIFTPHLPLLLGGGIAFLGFLTGLVFLIHALLDRLIAGMIRRPLDALSEGFTRLRAGDAGFRLEVPGRPGTRLFRPLAEAFNAAAAALEQGGSGGQTQEAAAPPDCRPSLELIRGGLEGIAGAIEGAPGTYKKSLGPQEKKIAALGHLLDQLILLVGLDRGAFSMNPGPLELGRFLEELAGELAEEYRNRDLLLTAEENREPLKVNIDAPWLRNVLVRLLDNSARHKCLDRGAAMLKCRRRETQSGGGPSLAEIIVIDNGPGIGEDRLPLLFDYRPGSLPKAPNGLGLAIAARIVKHLGGGIYAERPRRGGLSVTLCFPALPP